MRERALELKVGLFLLAALGLLTALIVVLGNVSLAKGFTVDVDFDFTGHLHTGAPVKVAGLPAGRVEAIRYLGGTPDPQTGRHVYVRVTAWIREDFANALGRDVEVYINTQGVLGEQYLEIVPGAATAQRVAAGDVLTGISPPRTDLILARLYAFLDGVNRLLREDRDAISHLLRASTKTLATVDQLLDENKTQIGSLLGHLDTLSAEGTRLAADLRAGLGDPRKIARLFAHLERTGAALSQQADPLLDKLNRVLAGAATLADGIGPTDEKRIAALLSQLLQLTHRAHAVAETADRLLSQLAEGKGTAGALLVKDELYDDLREMVADLKQNPWKFLWRE